jgi:kinetochore protein Nuf2
VFEWFAELLMNTTREVVAPAMRAAAEDLCGDDMDRIFTADTRELMGFFVALRRLLLEVSNTHVIARPRLRARSDVVD